MNYPIEEINRLIRERRSVFPKMYTGEPVDEAIIEQMLENANWAPTHKKTEPWRFTVFTGEGLKKLGDFQAELYKKVTTADGTYLEKKYNNLKTKPLMASHIIALGMKRDPEAKIPVVEEQASVAMAVQNMHLTAAAYGLGAYWGTGGVTYFEEAKEFFGLGPDDVFMGFFFVGTAQPDAIPESTREPIADKVSWVKA
ncbi:MAG TPA: nitroreductase [Cytophagales bacterium]|nr:nitroreductase [Cytophagales bacterium]HAA17765.1 nitroreductase [Cytophagales bacterium]HAP64615.1 nitroreductase [Cytophagales bacterium]